MIKLRRFHTPEVLAEIYQHPYDPTRWVEHKTRIRRTIEITQALIDQHDLKSVADLSCGDCSIIGSLNIKSKITGDITNDRSIEDALRDRVWPDVDLFICTETIEHLEAPWTVLERIAETTRWLVLSTPLDEDPAIGNYEHYWSFTQDDVQSMILTAGFVDLELHVLAEPGWTYTYQLWTGRTV